jgi:hypothetical protein
MEYPIIVDYSITDTEALDLRDDFDLVQTAALIAGIDPEMVRQSEDGHFYLKREWDCPCEEHRAIRPGSFKGEPLKVGTPDQHNAYSDASYRFTQWIDTVYSVVESKKLKTVGTPQLNTTRPTFRNMPRYAQAGAPDPKNTRVAREDIVAWLSSKGLTKGYFFRQTEKELKLKPAKDERLDFLNPKHPCYSPKLAASYCAWKAISQLASINTKDVKENLNIWINENLSQFDKNGKSLKSGAIEDAATVANWTYQK